MTTIRIEIAGNGDGSLPDMTWTHDAGQPGNPAYDADRLQTHLLLAVEKAIRHLAPHVGCREAGLVRWDSLTRIEAMIEEVPDGQH